jgi:hypothetical protein
MGEVKKTRKARGSILDHCVSTDGYGQPQEDQIMEKRMVNSVSYLVKIDLP